jgi:1,4-dihydroxy-2-naphthoate octaprenyltransferase
MKATFVAFLILICGVMIQIICNYTNDLYDFLKGADTSERIGPQRVVQSGLVSPREMRTALFVLIGVTLFLGSLLIFYGGAQILFIGILSLLAAFAYTGGPAPLAYLGLGEIFVLIFFGPVPVYGTSIILTSVLGVSNQLSNLIPLIILSLGISAISAAILVVNNIRDREQDARVDKKTVAVRIGEPGCRYEYSFLIFFALITPTIVLLSTGLLGFRSFSTTLYGFIFLALLLPEGARLSKLVRSADNASDFNSALLKSVRFLITYSVVVAVGWWIV